MDRIKETKNPKTKESKQSANISRIVQIYS